MRSQQSTEIVFSELRAQFNNKLCILFLTEKSLRQTVIKMKKQIMMERYGEMLKKNEQDQKTSLGTIMTDVEKKKIKNQVRK